MNYKHLSSNAFSIAFLGLALLSMVSMTILGCESDSGLIEHQSFAFQLNPVSSSTDSTNNEQSVSKALNNSRHIVIIGDERFSAEIATTDIEKSTGLSGRKSLPKKNGMLFVFQNYPAPAFWMKGMEFDLDLVWIDLNCTVVSITLNVPSPKSMKSENIRTYESSKPAHYVFEINAGEVTKYGIEVGNPVQFIGTKTDGTAC